MLTTVRLAGDLEQFGDWELDVSTPGEAFWAISVQCPEFIEHVHKAVEAGMNYHIFVGDRDICEEELGFPSGDQSITFMPAIGGSGTLFRIVAGIALIGLAGPLGGLGILGLTAANYTLVGVALVLGGIASLLTPTPSAAQPQENSNNTSSLFNGIVNTTNQGVPVPICYGEFIIGSATISSGVTTSQVG